MSDRPNVLLIGGPPGVGKTAVARAIADDTESSAHLSIDAFLEFVRGAVEPWVEDAGRQNRAVIRAAARAAATYAHAGYFVVVDGIFAPGDVSAFVAELEEDGELSVDLAILRAPVDVALARTRARGSVPIDRVVEELHEQFAALGADERHVVAAADRTPTEIAEDIRRRFAAGDLRFPRG